MQKHRIATSVLFSIILPILSFLVIAMDQIYKYKIRQTGGFYICNEGISFNIQIPFLTFWLILSTITLFYIYRTNPGNVTWKIGIGLILGGALSNLLDRLLFGCVIDHMYILKNILPFFNLADLAISLGGMLIFFKIIYKNTPKGA